MKGREKKALLKMKLWLEVLISWKSWGVLWRNKNPRFKKTGSYFLWEFITRFIQEWIKINFLIYLTLLFEIIVFKNLLKSNQNSWFLWKDFCLYFKSLDPEVEIFHSIILPLEPFLDFKGNLSNVMIFFFFIFPEDTGFLWKILLIKVL